MTLNLADRDPLAPSDDLTEGGTWLLDLVSAVDHLRRGHRPGLTVWGALAEAVDGHLDVPDSADLSHDELGQHMKRLAEHTDAETATSVQAALRHWLITMANRYNDGRHWPHPAQRRGFPPPAIDV